MDIKPGRKFLFPALVLFLAISLIPAAAALPVGDEMNTSNYGEDIKEDIDDFVEVSEGHTNKDLLNETGVTVDSIDADNNSVELTISSEDEDPRAVSVLVCNEILNATQEGEVLVEFDNETLELASDLEDALNVTEGEVNYWVEDVSDNSAQVIIGIGNWSEHDIEIYTSDPWVPGGIEDTLTDEFYGIPYWAWILVALGAVALLSKRRSRGREDR